MAALSSEELGRMDELRGCPAQEKAYDKKYSEADYFRTLMYSQGDRIAASLKTFFGVQRSEDISEITVCGEAIRWDDVHDAGGNVFDAGDNIGPIKQDSPSAVRPLGALCGDSKPESTTKCQQGVEYMPDLTCDVRTSRCVYKNPTSDKCSLDADAADSMSCDVERGKSGQIKRNTRKCDPAKTTDPEYCDENIFLKCVRNLCKKIPDGKFKPPRKGEEHGICRNDKDCPSRLTSDSKKPGKCVFETDCNRMWADGPHCKKNFS
jgi:hypothetical protein